MTMGELCQLCGVCCRGAFFRYALISDAEEAMLRAKGIPTSVRRNGQKAIRLGCAGQHGTLCSIWQERPRACEAYFCQLAFRLRDGLVTAEQAVAAVRQTQELLARIEADLPPAVEGDSPSLMERAYQYGLLSGPALLRQAEALFREHYLGPDQP